MKKSKQSAIIAENQSSVLDDPFDGFFMNNGQWIPEKGELLDISPARSWFKIFNWGVKKDLYTFQQAFESQSAPRVRLKGRELIMISSYDYLGLIGHPQIEAAAAEAIQMYGTGTGGVRLLTGTNKLHRQFELELAKFKGVGAAITFSSGYLANLAIISALLDRRDRVILDACAHRSIVDACRLARVQVQRFRHNDPASLAEILEQPPFGRRTLIVAEGVYSMDGDICPLPEIVNLKKKYGAFLMIDEAHSFGVLGKTGRGVDEHFGMSAKEVDIWMGSLSKAIPSNGGFLAGPRELIIYLQHGAAPFMFSAALSPASVAAARKSLRILRKEPERLDKLMENANFLRSALNDLGFDTGTSESHVIPIIVGNDKKAYWLARDLFGQGVAASAVVFPAVPKGLARLRLCATAAHDKKTLQRVLKAFKNCNQIS